MRELAARTVWGFVFTLASIVVGVLWREPLEQFVVEERLEFGHDLGLNRQILQMNFGARTVRTDMYYVMTTIGFIDSVRAIMNRGARAAVPPYWTRMGQLTTSRSEILGEVTMGWPFRATYGCVESPVETISPKTRWLIDSKNKSVPFATFWTYGLIPYRPIVPGVFGDVLFWGAASWAAAATGGGLRRALRRRRGRCPQCGYELNASMSLCPECGAAKRA
jgi:hypothetical protein